MYVKNWGGQPGKSQEFRTKITCQLDAPNLRVFSKRCFSDTSARLLAEANPFRGTENTWKYQCFQAFWCLLPLQILATLWTHHSEKHRLENSVWYSLKRGRLQGDGKKNVRKCHDKPAPFPSKPIWSEARRLMSSEVRKKGNWLGRWGALRTKPTGVRGTLCHNILCPVPFPASPSDRHREFANGNGNDLPLHGSNRKAISQKDSESHRGGRNKGGREQMRANANKRGQTLTNASKCRGENASKRGQMQTNAYNPLYCGFLHPPFAWDGK